MTCYFHWLQTNPTTKCNSWAHYTCPKILCPNSMTEWHIKVFCSSTFAFLFPGMIPAALWKQSPPVCLWNTIRSFSNWNFQVTESLPINQMEFLKKSMLGQSCISHLFSNTVLAMNTYWRAYLLKTKPSPRRHADPYQLKYQQYSAVNSYSKTSSTASSFSLVTFSRSFLPYSDTPWRLFTLFLLRSLLLNLLLPYLTTKNHVKQQSTGKLQEVKVTSKTVSPADLKGEIPT